MYAIVIGNLVDGITDVIGPFDTHEKAEHYIDTEPSYAPYSINKKEYGIYALDIPLTRCSKCGKPL